MVNIDPKMMMGERQAEDSELGPLFYSSDKDESATHLQSPLFQQGATQSPSACKLSIY